jgi:hypothetical protein
LGVVFAQDLKSIVIYVDGSRKTEAKGEIDTAKYDNMIFDYGSIGMGFVSKEATTSLGAFNGGMAWQYWFDYPLCQDEIRKDVRIEHCNSAVYPILADYGWKLPCGITAPPPPPPPPPPPAPKPPPLPMAVAMSTDYTDLGCWNDTGDRHLKGSNQGRPHDTKSCGAKAKTLGHKYFSVQDGNECYTGNDKYDKFGKAMGDCPPGGGPWKAHTWEIPGMPTAKAPAKPKALPIKPAAPVKAAPKPPAAPGCVGNEAKDVKGGPPGNNKGLIVIKEASYGKNCNAALKGNRTCLFKQLTTGKKKFEYKYNYTATGGDPAGGCGKTLEIIYNCLQSGGADKKFTAPAEAGFDANVVLNCDSAPASKSCENYMFAHGYDFAGGGTEAKGTKNNPAKLMAACSAKKDCVGIQSDGWMKTSISVMLDNPNPDFLKSPVGGTYLKKSTFDSWTGNKDKFQWKEVSCSGGSAPAAAAPAAPVKAAAPPAQKCAPPMGNPPAKVLGWTYKGCFKDCHQGRGLPNRLDNVNSIEACVKQAQAKGFNTSGSQYFGECWAGNNTDWNKMGDAGCCEPLGGGCTQHIYTSGGAAAAPKQPVVQRPASLPTPSSPPQGASTGCEGDAATLRCPSGVMTGIKYKYGKWNPGTCPGPNSGTSEKKFDEKVVTPGECVGKSSCNISLGNNWGDPWGGTRKEWVATPVCKAGAAPAAAAAGKPAGGAGGGGAGKPAGGAGGGAAGKPAGGAGGGGGNPGKSLGCWQDAPNRMFTGSNQGRPHTPASCAAKARSLGHKYAAVQDGNECYTGTDKDKWQRYGKAPYECPPTGGGWKAHVYQV